MDADKMEADIDELLARVQQLEDQADKNEVAHQMHLEITNTNRNAINRLMKAMEQALEGLEK